MLRPVPLALIIENDVATRRLLTVLLERLGMDVDAVEDGAEGIGLLTHVDYSVIFTDLFLPRVSGATVLAWMSRERPALIARTIALSAAPAELARVSGEHGVLTIRKPFELAEFTAAARRLMVAEQNPDPLFAAFVRKSVQAGAKAGFIGRVDCARLHVAASFNYADDQIAAFAPMPLDAPLPICKTVREDRPVWLPSIAAAAAEYPALVAVWEANATRGLAAVPVRHGSTVIGACGWSFGEPQPFHDEQRQRLTGIGSLVADSVGWYAGA